MKVSRLGALTGALILAGAVAPAAIVHGQSRAKIARAFDGWGSTAQIGVTVNDIGTDDAKQPKSGVLIEDVRTGSPAETAGMKTGDAIVEFDGERVRSVRQFQRLVEESAVGRSVPAVLSRAGSRVTVNVTPERGGDDFSFRLLDGARTLPPSPPTPPAMRPFNDFPEVFRIVGPRTLGVTLESLDEQLADYFGVKDGVLVKAVDKDSTGMKAGLKAGDVITAVNGRKVYEVSDVSRALNRVDEGGDFTIDVMRNKQPVTVKGKLENTRRRGRGVPTTF